MTMFHFDDSIAVKKGMIGMKLINGFIIFVVISAVLGIGSAFSCDLDKFKLKIDSVGAEESQNLIEDEEKIIAETDEKEQNEESGQQEKSKTDKSSNTSSQSNSKQEDSSKNTSSSSSTNSKNESSNQGTTNSQKSNSQQSTNNQQTSSSQSSSSNNQQTSSNQNNSSNQQSEAKKSGIWDELGITEDEYYNSPMLKWQKVTHSSFEQCQADGERIINDPTSGYTDYWCYQVNSYSGRMLGVMLKLT